MVEPVESPARLRLRHTVLAGRREALHAHKQSVDRELGEVEKVLALAPQVAQALDTLSEELFGKLAATISAHLTNALQEVLQQPIELKVKREFKRNTASMRFFVERQGQEEDILRGQGGSVANILSVGLRLLALMTLDEKDHRRCLVLDEQDCWLAPELVPRLVRMVHDAAHSLGFQVLMISHHPVGTFEQHADRIFRLCPSHDGIVVERLFDRQGP